MDIKVAGPEWANGCESCRFGIVFAPSVGFAPLYFARAILARHGHVLFCECRAGQTAQRHAERVFNDVISGRESVHPATLAAILATAERTPTVHGTEPIAVPIMERV